jgi:hypothetical protein
MTVKAFHCWGDEPKSITINVLRFGVWTNPNVFFIIVFNFGIKIDF